MSTSVETPGAPARGAPARGVSAGGVPDGAAPTPLFRMQGITKRFPGVLALDGVGFEVRRGEVHCLMGENGAGKSTLMKILSGVYGGYEGQMFLDGRAVAFAGTREAQDAGISIIHQELNLVPELTVYENIFLGREIRRALGVVDRAAMRQRAGALLASLGLDIEPDRPVGRLRVGQRQLVEIAKALSLDARIVIMDEPTSALSDAEVELLFQVIRRLCAAGVAVIYISHRLDEIFAIADQVTVLRDGRVVGTAPAAEMTPARIIRMMVGRDLSVLYPKAEVVPGEPVLTVEGLSYRRGGAFLLKDVSLTVRRGEIVGVAGLMGAGRTELLEAVFGAFPPGTVAGTVRFGDRAGVPASPRAAIAAGIGLVAEDRKQQSLILERSVSDNASLAALRRFLRPLGVIDRRAERRAVGGIVGRLGVRTPGLQTPVGALSGGNQQKVVIGKFLLTDTDLFLLDEPTRGVDVGAKAEIYRLVGELAAAGKAFLVVSSELPELLAVCDRIYVLCRGRITAEFARDAFDQEAIMEAATRFQAGESGERLRA